MRNRNPISVYDTCMSGESVRAAILLHVLHHAAEQAVYGQWMIDELARHGYRVSPGTMYPTLHRMERDGLLAGEDVVVDGRRRRLYCITPKGEAALDEGRRAVRELAGEVLPSTADGAVTSTVDGRASGGRSSEHRA